MLYDISPCAQGITFTLFGIFPIHKLRFDNIKSVREIKWYSLGSATAYNFKNRLFARAFFIETYHGWFARKLLVTPKSADDFIAYMTQHNIDVIREVSQSSQDA
jgi:hypothetical protein